jgi:tetratricopeptide (TPR) repeat protein
MLKKERKLSMRCFKQLCDASAQLLAIACALTCLNSTSTRAAAPEAATEWDRLSGNAIQSMRANDLPAAVRFCNRAMALALTFSPTDTHYSRSQVLRAEIYLWENKYDAAEQMFKEAVVTCEKAAGTNSLELVQPLSSLANYYYYVAPHLDRVAALFERILRIVESAPTSQLRDRIMWSRNLGKVYQAMKNYARAEPLFKRAVALCEKQDAEWLPYELLASADFYRDWGKTRRAESLARRALKIREKALLTGGVDAQIGVTVCLANLGATALAAHKPKAAEADFRRSLGILEKAMPEESELIPHAVGLAEALGEQRQFEEAACLYERTLAIAAKNQIAESREIAGVLEKYGALLQEANRTEEAQARFAKAKAIRTQLEASAARSSGGMP